MHGYGPPLQKAPTSPPTWLTDLVPGLKQQQNQNPSTPMAAPSNPFDGMVVMGGSSPPPASPYDNRAPEPEPTSPSSPGHLQQMPVSPQQQQQQQTSPGAKAAINGMVSGMGNMVMSADV